MEMRSNHAGIMILLPHSWFGKYTIIVLLLEVQSFTLVWLAIMWPKQTTSKTRKKQL